MNEFGGNPLLSDDRTLNNPSAIEFGATPRGLDLNGNRPAAPLGMQGMPDIGDAAMAQIGQIASQPLVPPAAPSNEPQMFYSPSTGDMVVNGFSFNQRNATQALASEQWANQPRQQFTLPDTATDWRALSRAEYQSYLDDIRNPGYGRRMGEAWEHAWRGVGDVALGASLAANPNWEWADTARQNIAREYEENAPFMMRMRDVQNPGDALTYASQMLVQGAPWIVETIASMAAGAAIGGVVSGGLGAPAGAVEGFIAKEALRRSTMTALQSTLRRGAEAYAQSAARRGVAQVPREAVIRDAVRAGTASADDVNRFFNFGERAYHLTRGARDAAGDVSSVLRSTGAIAGSTASNYATAVGDIRNTIADAGGDPTSAEAIAQIWGMAIPYAAIESVGDFIITQPITHIFPGIASGPSRLGNAARGAATGFTTEAAQETAQYALTQNAAAQVTDTPLSLEPIDLLETAVGGGLAGAGVGGIIGAIGQPTPRNAGLLPPPSIAMGGPTSTPSGSTPPGGYTPRADLGAMSAELAGLRAQESGGAYMGAVQDELAAMPPAATDGQAINNTLYGSDLSPEERQAALDFAAINERMRTGAVNDPDVEAAMRGASQQSRGVTPIDGPTQGPPDLRVPITQEELAGLQGPGRQETRADIDIPPALPQMGPVRGGTRSPVQIFQDLTMGVDVPREEMLQLREAIVQLQQDNPTNPGFPNLLRQLDSMLVQAPAQITDENSPEFQREFPELSAHLANKPPGFTQSPMEAARPQRTEAGPMRPAATGMRVNNLRTTINKDGSQTLRTKLPTEGVARQLDPNYKAPVGNDGLRGRTQETTAKTTESGTDLLDRTYQLANAGALSELSDEELNRVHQITKVKKGKATHQELHKKLSDELEERQRRKGKKPRNRLKKKLDKEGEGRFVSGDMIVTPVKEEPKQTPVEAKEEKPDAVQERSPKAIPPKEQPRTGEKDGSRDRTRYEAPRESPKPTSDEKVQRPEVDDEVVGGRVVSKKRVDIVYKAGAAEYETLYNFQQAVVGMLGRQKDAKAQARNNDSDPAIHTGKDWAKINNKPITLYELRAVEQRLKALGVDRHNRNGVVAEPKPDAAEKKAARFADDLSDAFKQNKDDPKFFSAFVLAHRAEVATWLLSADAKARAGLRVLAERVLRENPPTIQMAAGGKKKFPDYTTLKRDRLVMPEYAKVVKGNPLEKGNKANVAGIRSNLLFVEQQLNLINTNRASKPGLTEALRALDATIKLWPKVSSDTDTLNKLQSLRGEVSSARNEISVQQASPVDAADAVPNGKKLSTREIKSRIDKIQKNISPTMHYRDVHVVESFQELMDMAEELQLTYPEGHNTTLADMGASADPQGDYRTFLKSHLASARAANIPYFNALIVIKDNLKHGTEEELLQVLEHEYIVHFGLRALFDNDTEREAFLQRLGAIPGMEEKRQALLQGAPVYAYTTNYPGQLEELIAFHAMEGPLALKQLLSAPEAIDKETRRTLWEDFVILINKWINSVFGIKSDTADMLLDYVVHALREHAIVGTAIDLNARLDAIGVPSFAEIYKRTYGIDPPGFKVQQAVASSTMEDTTTLLYGTNTNPGRPYTPTTWTEDMTRTIKSNLPLMEKLKELGGKGVGTTTREALKKVSRNIETMNNMAMRSTLVEKTMEIMHNTISVARRIMTKRLETRDYMAKAAEFAPMRKLWGDKAPGSTKEQRDAYNRMAVVATNGKLPLVSESIIKAAPRILVRNTNGSYQINYAVFEALLALGTYSKAEFEAGIEQFTVHGDGIATSTGVTKLPQEVIDAGYDIYVRETRHMATSHLETLENALIMLTQMNDTTVKRLLNDSKLSERDQVFMDDTLQHMYKLYADIAFHEHLTNNRTQRYKQQEAARHVLAELMRAMHEKEKVTDWIDPTKKRDESAKSPRKNDAFKWREQTDPHKDVAPFTNQVRWFLENDPATGTNRLERMNTLGIGKTPQLEMLGAFQALLNTETMAYQHENDVIQSTLGNYVEFTRKGQWRVAVDIKDKKGNPADVGQEFAGMLPVVYVRSEREAKDLIQELKAELDGTHTVNNAAGDPIEVTFDVRYGKAPGTRTLAEAPKIKEFLKVADLAGLSLNATQMKTVANLIEHAASRKRFGLQRAGTPGMDADILENNNETMTRRAWWAAKMSQAWQLEDIFDDSKNTFGDWDKLKQLQNAFDIANRGAIEGQPTPISFRRNEDQVYLAETALLRYANQLRYMSEYAVSRPEVIIRTTAGEQKLTIKPEGSAHHNHAIALKESLERNELELNLNDLISKTGPLRMSAVVMQLGSIASGIMNAFTVITHLPHELSARHSKTGYGEGFSYVEVIAEIISAITTVGKSLGMMDPIVVKDLLDRARAGDNNTGLTLEELEFVYDQSLTGELAAQQTYSLTGGTENSIRDLIIRNISQALLLPFGSVEAASRRVSALVTYRLSKKRYIRAGVSESALNDSNSPEYKRLVTDVNRVIRNSQGDYANINRPKAARGDLAQYVLQYKMFPLISTLLMYNLPVKQQAAMLGVLFLLGGLKGEPFADDIMDIYDTLLQKLGFTHDSVELQLIQTFEGVLPGSSKWIMTGAIDTMAFGGTMSSRVSMGDILPMTGAFREGADMGREIANAFGPASAANVSVLEWAWTLTDFTMQTMGIKAQTTSWQELIRKMPQAQVRGVGEAALMAATGEITDPRGRLVSDDVTAFNIMSRALGFYPLEATKANTAVRLDRMHIGYMRAIRARYILAYANAYRADNQEQMDNIRESVREWNEAAEQTGQEDMMIHNFRSAAMRAGRAAAQTTIERTSSSAPDYSLIDELAEIVNADTESED